MRGKEAKYAVVIYNSVCVCVCVCYFRGKKEYFSVFCTSTQPTIKLIFIKIQQLTTLRCTWNVKITTKTIENAHFYNEKLTTRPVV